MGLETHRLAGSGQRDRRLVIGRASPGRASARHSPRGRPPCCRISSIACCAEAASVTAISSGQPKYCWVAWARRGPANSHRSPNLPASFAIPASMEFRGLAQHVDQRLAVLK
jgi:hypothetical protein